MGSETGDVDEQPIHTVYLDPYYIDKYEVTNGLYEECVAAGACEPPGQVGSSNRSNYYDDPAFSQYPVIFVDWDQAKTYCEWRGGSLPTEAQWEKAARGTDGRTYPWGEGIDCDRANYDKTISSSGEVGCPVEVPLGGIFLSYKWSAPFPLAMGVIVGDTTAVGSYPRGVSPYGAHDMAGNVWEWVSDWYRADYYAALPPTEVTRNPRGPSSSYDPDEPGVAKRVHRGGSFLCTDQYCSRYMVGTRGKGEVATGTNHVGFRTVLEPAPR